MPIAGDPTATLAVTDPGVYPLMINFNATIRLSSGDLPARVGEVHLLLTVLSVPPAPALPGGTAPEGATTTSGTGTGGTTKPGGDAVTGPPADPASHQALPYAMVWTIVDRPHLGVDGSPERRPGPGDLTGWPALSPALDDDVRVHRSRAPTRSPSIRSFSTSSTG